MASTPPVTSWFGAAFVQSATTFTITKANLQNPDWTYTPDPIDPAYHLATALINLWRNNQDTSSDSHMVLSDWTPTLIQRGTPVAWYTRNRITIDVYTPAQVTNPNPDDVVV